MGHELTIEPLGEVITVADGQTILDACLRAGIWLPHACGHGLCGTCKVDVVDGQVDHAEASPFALMDFERAGGKTLACTARLLEDVVIEAEVDEDPDQRRIPVADYDATVAAIADLTHDVKGIRLALDGAMDFQAGQYINLHIPTVAGTRAFSIANPPHEREHVDLQIRRVPGGQGTAFLHDQLKVGDRVRFSGPYGRFFVRKSRGGPLLFLAGGTGVSSPRSMVLDLLAEGWSAPITLIHGVRAELDLYDRALFEDLVRRHPHFRYVPVLSAEPDGSGWAGARGFVHEVAEHVFDGTFEGQSAYLCGPPPMIEASIGALMRGRLFEKHIFTERFLTASDGAEKKSPVFRGI
ncbi:NADH:ubiquinone reductase (Na(+)-transporting) subunit F [Xanthobacter sp. YC-JY1]|uniref:NADH:ubiquinone reductase (Na(+)-transporting) subunit F n=1 Tax=Xanthobacter sp. YC-JY1 TaxID=2419844 RepID=UPI001F393FD4|nr:2Fe-2S iron-sulfur cluster binding domain-containing protein [Xanthobacter sp. YC-JY1]UJX45715.1 phenol hydroxylase [Xanthobacter sp. YC-JY1]